MLSSRLTTDWYVVTTVPSQKSRINAAVTTGDSESRPHGRRMAYFPESGGMVSSLVVDRYAMVPGKYVEGPALIEEREATTVILPGDKATIGKNGHLMIEIGGR
jgi:N-methylhydantoinase A